MANPAHLSKLKEGVQSYNEWLLEHPYEPLDDLENADLSSLDLSGCLLYYANLKGANLRSSNLTEAELSNADLTGADLTSANLSNADLRGATLDEACLDEANLEGAKLEGASLQRARIRETNLSRASLVDSDLGGADLNGSVLIGANLLFAKLKSAKLTKVDLQQCHYLILDGNEITDAQFGPGAKDPWSVLRREYTGIAVVLNLLIFIAFLAKQAAQLIQLQSIRVAQSWANKTSTHVDSVLGESLDRMRDRLGAIPGPHTEGARQILDELAVLRERLSDRLESVSTPQAEAAVWEIMLSIREGWLGTLTTVLFAYNLLRYFMTKYVAAMREEEERSNHAPEFVWRPWRGYRGLSIIHRFFMRWVFWVSIAALGWHLWSWSTDTIMLFE